jgi:hypothetical protein
MPYRKVTKRSLRLRGGESSIIGFRLPKEMAQAVKVEASKRELALNALFVEMWELYMKQKRAK